METSAVMCGISATEYWDMTYGEIAVTIEAYNENFRNELKVRAQMDYALAVMINNAFAGKPQGIEQVYPALFDAQQTEAYRLEAGLRSFAAMHNAKLKEGDIEK